MLEAGYYAPVHVVELQEYLDGLTQAMRELLVAAYRRTDNMPVPKPAPKPAPKPEAKPVPPPVRIDVDPDGFDVPAGGADKKDGAEDKI